MSSRMESFMSWMRLSGHVFARMLARSELESGSRAASQNDRSEGSLGGSASTFHNGPCSISCRARIASSPTFSARASDAIATSASGSKAEMLAAASDVSRCGSLLHTLTSRTRSPATA
eukprot:scaffold32657_cov31-Tisochrysis_lutea.AAC.3